MKVSELIKRLQELVEEHGDKCITVTGDRDNEHTIYDIDHWPNEFTIWTKHQDD